MNKRVYKQVKKQFKKGINGHRISISEIEKLEKGFNKECKIKVEKQTLKRFYDYSYNVEVCLKKLEEGLMDILGIKEN